MLGTPIRNRQAERREATRHEIIDVAWVIARERGLSEVTLRDVADRVGMRAPSLYTHFDSKNAIYDAMFAQAWTEFVEMFDALEPPAADREALLTGAEAFFDFAAADLARYQLMNQRTIPVSGRASRPSTRPSPPTSGCARRWPGAACKIRPIWTSGRRCSAGSPISS